MSIAAVPASPEPAAVTGPQISAEAVPAAFVETYYADGGWHSRRHDAAVPFATGTDQLDQIALGSQVARWNRLPHIVRTPTGEIAEILPPS